MNLTPYVNRRSNAVTREMTQDVRLGTGIAQADRGRRHGDQGGNVESDAGCERGICRALSARWQGNAPRQPGSGGGAHGSRSISRILSRVIIYLGRTLLSASCGTPGCLRRAAAPRVYGGIPTVPCFAWGLPGQCVATLPVRSYRAVSPLPGCRRRPGGFFSVALSVGSPRLAVSEHAAL